MKWFKHYSSLHRQPESQATIRKLGYEWYGRYMVILGECAEQYDGDKSATTFILLVDQLKTTLRVVGDQWLTSLRLLGEYQGFTFEVVGEFIKLNIPIIAELHHKDSTSSKTRRATLGNVAGRDKEKDKEGDKDRDYTPRERGKKTDLPALAILWNEHCPSLAKVKGTNPARNKKAAERLAESNPEEWVQVLKKIESSQFCKGLGPTGWKATFDWILQPSVRLKVLEGTYDNRSGSSSKVLGIQRDVNQEDQIQQAYIDAGLAG